jgi:osmoprotectant transport system substrate-binding protein
VLVVAVGVLSSGDDGGSESADPRGEAPSEDRGKDTKPGDSGSAGAGEPDPDLAIAGRFDLTGLEMKIDAPGVTDRDLLAYMTVLALEEAGADAEVIVEVDAIGPRERRSQLLAGDIDLFWDAVGSPGEIASSDLPDNASAEELRDALIEVDKPNGLTWLEPVDYSSDSTVAMRRAESERLGITSLEDLPALAEADRGATTICYTTEPFVDRIEEDYGFEFFDRTFVPDPFVTYDEVADGSCTFAIVPYGVRPSMAELDLVALDDPDSTFMSSHVAPRLRLGDYEDHPEIGNVLGPIARNIDGTTMAELVARVEIGGEDPAAVALDYLVTQGFLTP